MNNCNFKDIPGFSRLFLSFIDEDIRIACRFPNNFIEKEELFKKVLVNNSGRDLLSEVIGKTSIAVNPNSLQKQNLEMLRKDNVLTVMTGQQPGFLGGPIYTVLKAFTAAGISQKMNDEYPDFRFVPVFWVEDNDHDYREASQVYFYDNDYKPVFIDSTSGKAENPRICCSERFYDDDIVNIINNVINMSRNTVFKEEIITLLRDVYVSGKNWSSAFIEIMNYFLGGTGMLFISASEVRKAGLFKSIVLKELGGEVGISDSIINDSNKILENDGFHIQARSSTVNLFYHTGIERNSIEFSGGLYNVSGKNISFTKNEIIAEAESHPENFSPKVLLRPIIQDSILPSAVYVAGPSEIGYLAQLKELYKHFGIIMPAFESRYSALFIDKAQATFLEKNNLGPLYFLRDANKIVNELTKSLSDKSLTELLEGSEKIINRALDSVFEQAALFDDSLKRSVEATIHKISKEYESMSKKFTTATKNKNSVTFEKYRRACDFFFPFSTLQERMYTPLCIVNSCGLSAFAGIMKEMCSLPQEKVYFIEL